MLKKTFEYVDFNEVKQKEDFYFHLSKSELLTMEVSVKDGLGDMLKQIVKSEDGGEMTRILREIILKSVGIKSEDGKRFIKNDKIADDFAASPAFDQLFFEVATDADKAAAFIKGAVPPEFAESFDEAALAEFGVASVSDNVFPEAAQ